MSTVIIMYEAKCKHCIHMKYKPLIKNDGTKSKVMRAYCDNPFSKLYKKQLTLKSKACDFLQL